MSNQGNGNNGRRGGGNGNRPNTQGRGPQEANPQGHTGVNAYGKAYSNNRFGTPSKLNKETINKAYQFLKEGNYETVVASLIGISSDTWFKWKREGEGVYKALSDLPEGTSDAEIDVVLDKTMLLLGISNGERAMLVAEFYATVKKATSEAENAMVSRIRKAAGEHWQAAAWFLERKFKDRWGKETALKVTEVNVKPYQEALEGTAAQVFDDEEEDLENPADVEEGGE